MVEIQRASVIGKWLAADCRRDEVLETLERMEGSTGTRHDGAPILHHYRIATYFDTDGSAVGWEDRVYIVWRFQ